MSSLNNYIEEQFMHTLTCFEDCFKHASCICFVPEIFTLNNVNRVFAETESDLIKRLNEWKDNVEIRGMSVNMNITKVMISGKQQKVMQKAVRWPSGVCGRCIGNNEIQCTSCRKWVHRKCGIKGSMYKVMKTSVCRGCMNPVTTNQYWMCMCGYWCRCISGVSG